MNGSQQAPDALAMRSAGALAYIEAEMDSLEEQLQQAPDWRPARMLLAELDWLRGKVRELADAWDRKLVVAIAGPSGAGKSTLLNALAGRELSRTGLQRPTTREVVVYAAARSDAEHLLEHLGDGAAEVHVAADARPLESFLLVDTPDTNTLPENQRLLARVLERADLVLAVFPVQNPKMLDNIAFLEPYVRHLPDGAVTPVLNMVDRVPREQLDEIVADFRVAIDRQWGREPGRVFLVSALEGVRGNGAAGGLPADERPLHDVNELRELEDLLFSSLNRAGEVVDRRLAHAEHLLALLREHAADVLAESDAARRQARVGLDGLLEEAQKRLAEGLQEQARRGAGFPANAALYGMLAGRWWGPVAWLVVFWAFLLRAAGYVGRLGRSTRPLFLVGQEPADGGLGLSQPGVAASLVRVEALYAERWPALADDLVRAGFAPGVREGSRWRDDVDEVAEAVQARSAHVLGEHLARLAEGLSAWPLQVLLNAPVVGMVAWVMYDTIAGFFSRAYLPADYFRHAGIAALVVWLASLAVLQVIVAVALRRALGRRAAGLLASDAGGSRLMSLQRQLAALEGLSQNPSHR